jgi:hypothetical protein
MPTPQEVTGYFFVWKSLKSFLDKDFRRYVALGRSEATFKRFPTSKMQKESEGSCVGHIFKCSRQLPPFD